MVLRSLWSFEFWATSHSQRDLSSVSLMPKDPNEFLWLCKILRTKKPWSAWKDPNKVNYWDQAIKIYQAQFHHRFRGSAIAACKRFRWSLICFTSSWARQKPFFAVFPKDMFWKENENPGRCQKWLMANWNENASLGRIWTDYGRLW